MSNSVHIDQLFKAKFALSKRPHAHRVYLVTLCTVVGFKLRGHFKFFFIIMSDVDTFFNGRVSIV